ncbi:class I SAM-dependent methyltransferase [Methylicorpusculum sp.]|uniref:class I SAM-dependent methyltransferase n=1 Tax=Methylicorpusculum sp. TaxID=2713644 RepID=UPI002730905A|nr:class I SAM-dependent methyltransferase [Methylicorpusculum sp.]MDP2179615.1 class I SAM-dependent methyltransferase [Methylicorpusculum sp.]MDP3529253.1 class I SAM-dependent methyltransferase [Methylicorpusculum sp.]MDZ4150427.1 class I SAM-dependent methyltransferase [Methylicorpusculum sp.]
MLRQTEPELMLDPAQVEAYALADFSIPHNRFVELLQQRVSAESFCGMALDLGCGPGDISARFVKAFQHASLHAVDGSLPMLSFAAHHLPADVLGRIEFIHAKLPRISLPCPDYDLIFSNSLLHHLPEPQALWRVIKDYSRPGTQVAVMDLVRPASQMAASELVEHYSADEPAILKHDFYHSLLAAFTLEEIEEQLKQARLNLNIELVSDRHVFISGLVA